jgi:DtxR family Mn-dependent transcriptional regulator
MAATAKLSASLEDYLEAIHEVVAQKDAARAKDVADRLGVAASSVTNALRALVKRGLVNHAPYDLITLTDEGRVRAGQIVQRHEALTDFLTKVLGVDDDVAADCACKMEHAVPDVVLERLIEYIRFREDNAPGGPAWIEGKGFVCGHGSGVKKGCGR